jgi:hypothetical protein
VAQLLIYFITQWTIFRVWRHNACMRVSSLHGWTVSLIIRFLLSLSPSILASSGGNYHTPHLKNTFSYIITAMLGVLLPTFRITPTHLMLPSSKSIQIVLRVVFIPNTGQRPSKLQSQPLSAPYENNYYLSKRNYNTFCGYNAFVV